MQSATGSWQQPCAQPAAGVVGVVTKQPIYSNPSMQETNEDSKLKLMNSFLPERQFGTVLTAPPTSLALLPALGCSDEDSHLGTAAHLVSLLETLSPQICAGPPPRLLWSML